MDALEKAIKIAGGPSAVARKLGLKSRMAVWHWKKRGIPPEHVLKLCELTQWQVKPNSIAPTLYPHPDDGLPIEKRKG